MNMIIKLIWLSISIGFMIEIFTTAISRILDWNVTKEDKKLIGYISLWMAPIYGICLPFIYLPLSKVIQDYNIFLQGTIFGIGFLLIEFLSGWAYHKFMKIRPWDYAGAKLSIYGYIRLDFFPLWALVGLGLKYYFKFFGW